MNGIITRGGFLKGLGALALAQGAASCCRAPGGRARRRDPDLVALVSDLHVNGRTPEHSTAEVAKTLAEILALDPLPSRLICLGDMARDTGAVEDYRAVKELFAPIAAAGIEIRWLMGNHDRRATFAEVFPEAMRATRVPGRLVQVVGLSRFDCVLMDSLVEPADPKEASLDDGEVDAAQVAWLEDFAKGTQRPFLVFAHHDGRQMKAFAKRAMKSSPLMCGYVHGHRHSWMKDTLHVWGEPWPCVRSAGLPSAGFWGDIGYALLRDEGDRATIRLRERDCWYPKPGLPRDRAALCRRNAHENDNDTVVFD